MQIRRLDSLQHLFSVTDGDYLVRANTPPDAKGHAWVTEDGTVAYIGAPEEPGGGRWLDVIGDPGTASAVLRFVVADAPEVADGFSVPRGTDVGGIEIASEPDVWDFMTWDATVPGTELPFQPGEELVCALPPGAEADAEISALLAEANPHHSTKPGWDRIDVWGGIRSADTGGLLAVGALCHRGAGVPWLASIGTHPDARGRGYGAAVTAWLTRRAAESGGGVFTLGHYVPNEAARRIYLRLGYRTTHQMFSGRFA